MGPTSHDVVAAVRRATRTRRVGHAGTLDPFAQGLLPVLVGRATRLAPYLLALPKTYDGVLRLGVRTDTDDLDGTVIGISGTGDDVSDADLDAAMTELTGTVEQTPPRYSAKKVRGTPAYRRVRRGESVTLEPRVVRIDRFVRTGRSGPDVAFTTTVGSGTYVRALARDVGDRLGCGAHLTALRRTAVGPFRVDCAVPLATVQNGEATILPPLAAIPHLPTVPLSPAEAEVVRHGRALPAPGDATGSAALVADGVLVAVAEAAEGTWRPRVVLDAI